MSKLWQRLLMQQSSPPAPAGTAYRYYRMHATAHNHVSYVGFAEIALRAVAGGPSLHTLSIPVTASSAYSGWEPEKTLQPAGAWANSAATSGKPPHWIKYDMLTPVALAEIGMRAAPNATYLPKDFELQGSNDGVAWTTLKSYAGYVPAAGWHIFSLI